MVGLAQTVSHPSAAPSVLEVMANGAAKSTYVVLSRDDTFKLPIKLDGNVTDVHETSSKAVKLH